MEKSFADVELHNASYSFGDNHVLSAISVAFRKNEVTAVLGRSGSGKSTLLQIINGMLKPTSGGVKLFGKALDYKSISGTRLQIGYVIQQAGLFPHMSIEKNIGLLGIICRQPGTQTNKRLKHLLQMVQLPLDYLSKYPHELSGGEQQRAGLCRAMLLNPPVMLMDEPFASLDYTTKHKIYEYILAMQQSEPRTIIFVTHDWEEAMLLADNFVWIEKGKLKAEGTKTDLAKMKDAYLSKT